MFLIINGMIKATNRCIILIQWLPLVKIEWLDMTQWFLIMFLLINPKMFIIQHWRDIKKMVKSILMVGTHQNKITNSITKITTSSLIKIWEESNEYIKWLHRIMKIWTNYVNLKSSIQNLLTINNIMMDLKKENLFQEWI